MRIKNLPILIDVAHVPFVLEEVHHWDLSFIGFKKVENTKSLKYGSRILLLAMAGLVLFPNNIQSFRMEDNYINIISLDNKQMKVQLRKLQSLIEI